MILYANKQTKSIVKAIGETKRRRDIQHTHNLKNNIIPATIKKAISGGVLETLRGKKARVKEEIETKKINSINPKEIDARIKELQVRMKAYAKALEFEQAAKLRDEVKELKDLRMLF